MATASNVVHQGTWSSVGGIRGVRCLPDIGYGNEVRENVIGTFSLLVSSLQYATPRSIQTTLIFTCALQNIVYFIRW